MLIRPALLLGMGLLPFISATLVALPADASAAQPGGGTRFVVDYSPAPLPAAYEGFDLVILDPGAEVPLPREAPGDEGSGPSYLAYLSVVEIPAGAAYAAEARQQGLVLEGVTNEVWNSACADIADAGWEEFVVERLAAQAVQKGFAGFFLDTADSIARLPGAGEPAQRDKYQACLASLINRLQTTYPERAIILNRGFELVELLPEGSLAGVLVESVFQTYDHATKTYGAVREGDTRALSARITSLRERGLPVFVIDYVDPADPDLAAATAGRIEDLGASALVTTPDLQGMVLAPGSPVARQILVLYGAAPGLTAEDPVWAVDTLVSKFLQAPLEWMGYELRYHHARKERPPETLSAEFAGVIVDAGFVVRRSEQKWHAEWLVRQAEDGRKVLLAGAYPFEDAEAREHLLEAFGIGGTGDPVSGMKDVRIVAKDAIYDFESEVRPMPLQFLDVTAPAGARNLLRLDGKDARGATLLCDPAFLADWGGVLMSPYWIFEASTRDARSFIDPFAFLGGIWPAGNCPVPDPTTREGLRLYWSHIDGDAFTTLSTTRRDTTCAEVLRDRIFKVYPLPATVSVIEAEIRSIQETQDPAQSPRYEAIARDIFELPHIEAASHAYTHPFVWSPEDVAERDYYANDHLRLHSHFDYNKVDCEREIAGSVEYIERRLLPEGKKVKVMLWSGNCRPFAEAVAVTERLGIENMNGGYTIHSPRHPHLGAVAPRVTWWDGHLQIFTANQNDFVYTDDWYGPFYGGFERVIGSFKMLDAPRRLKAVNVYYHFYSGLYPGSVKALERIHDWVLAQPLHPVTASEAAAITRDTVQTRIRRTGAKRWLVSNAGRLTTFRMPQEAGYPDLAASTNVTGFNDHGTERYIHTNGEPCAEIVLAPDPRRHLRLQSSEAVIRFQTLARDHCAFTTRALRPAEVVLGGAAPASTWTLTVVSGDGPEQTAVRNLTADAAGTLVLALPKAAEVSLAPAATTAAN